jgi:hypothetical protein
VGYDEVDMNDNDRHILKLIEEIRRLAASSGYPFTDETAPSDWRLPLIMGQILGLCESVKGLELDQ